MDVTIDKKVNEIIVGFMGHFPPMSYFEREAVSFLNESYDAIQKKYPDEKKRLINCASSQKLTIIAYREAEKRGWEIIPTDEAQTPTYLSVGSRPKYLDEIDALVSIGGEFKSLYVEEAKAKGKLAFHKPMPFLLGGG